VTLRGSAGWRYVGGAALATTAAFTAMAVTRDSFTRDGSRAHQHGHRSAWESGRPAGSAWESSRTTR
jgi:hypothetical protein